MRRGTRDDASSDTGKILLDAVHDQTVLLHYDNDRVLLTGPDFGSQHPVGGKKPRCSLGYRPVRPQTILTTIESPPWVVADDLTGQPRECFARDVGRIRENGIKLPRQRSRPIAYDKASPIGKVQIDGVAGGGPHRVLGDIDTNSARCRKLGKERQQEAARTGAEIEQTAGRASIRLSPEHRLDDCLRLGSRIESVARQTKFQPPELAPFEDAAQRLAGEHTAQQRPNPTDLLFV